jgi:hypothetical protein
VLNVGIAVERSAFIGAERIEEIRIGGTYHRAAGVDRWRVADVGLRPTECPEINQPVGVPRRRLGVRPGRNGEAQDHGR